METYDDWHFDWREIDGYNAPINFADSCRGTGKTTGFWRKSWYQFSHNQRKTIVQTRLQCNITDIFIDTIRNEIGKFATVPTFKYAKKGMGKEGMVDVFCGGSHYLRILAMSTPLSKLKNLFLDDCAYWWTDEYICNERLGERYIKGEAFKFKEAWGTFFRENPTMKAYFSGNPYSSYNPYFSEFGIDPSLLVKGKILSGGGNDPAHPLWVAQNYLPNDRLLSELKKNPMYSKEADEYTRFALYGESVNDKNIWIEKNQPAGFFLRFFFRMEGKLIAVWESGDYGTSPRYWCTLAESVGKRHDVYCFDFKDLSERSVLFSHDEKNRFGHFRMAIRNRDVAFSSVECDYLIEEIYQTL